MIFFPWHPGRFHIPELQPEVGIESEESAKPNVRSKSIIVDGILSILSQYPIDKNVFQSLCWGATH